MATSNVNNVVQIGGGINGGFGLVIPVSDWSSIVSLSMATNGSVAANAYVGFGRGQGGFSNSVAQITSGKTFYAPGFYLNNSASLQINFGYATASFTSGTTTPPPTQFNYAPSSTERQFDFLEVGSWRYFPIPLSFPSLSFPFVFSGQWATGATGEFGIFMVGQEK